MICKSCEDGNHNECIDKENDKFEDALDMLEPMCDCKCFEKDEDDL